MKQNYLVFNESLIKSYTRVQALKSRNEYIRPVRSFYVRRSEEKKRAINPFTLKCIPPKTQLISWSNELAKLNNLASGRYYLECELGNLSYKGVNTLLSLHTAKEVKPSVEQEINWFNAPKLVPRSVASQPPTTAINCFKSLIRNHPNLQDIPGYGLKPGVLAQLCNTREITGDLVSFLISLLNSTQSSVHCIIANDVRNIGRYVARRIDPNCLPKYLLFITNVGSYGDGRTFCGSDAKPGCHWTIAFYSHDNRTLSYGDSLGWAMPEDLRGKIDNFADKVFGCNRDPIRVVLCHDPKVHRHGVRECGESCSKRYPFQRCGKVCGVVVLVMAAIACHDLKFWLDITTNQRPNDTPLWYLSEPTKYSKYLRLVLMAWFAEQRININFILPAMQTTIIDESDSDEDEDVIRANVQRNFEEATAAKKVIKVEEQTTQERRGKSAKIENERGKSTDKDEKSFKCPVCPQKCAKKANLRRHIERWHKNNVEAVKQLQSGKCVCLECSENFRRIVDLREHLIKQHEFTFRMETVEFQNRSGEKPTIYLKAVCPVRRMKINFL